MHKAFYISLLFVGLSFAAQAQKKVIYEDTSLLQKDEVQLVEDIMIVQDSTGVAGSPIIALDEDEPADTTLKRNGLNLSYDSIKNWRTLKEYAYTKYLDSLLKGLKKKEVKERKVSLPRRSLFGDLFGSILSVLLWTIAIAFVLFILYRLFLAEGVFKRRSKSANNAEAEVVEEIITNESDFDALIRQALQNSHYRLAVRYQYLRTLHLLAGKNLVQLAPDKTNFQYVSEIANRNHQQPFAALTLNYEYVWYGEFVIDKNIYEKIESNFKGFNQKI